MPPKALIKGELKELRFLNLVNPVNLVILSKSCVLEDSQILIGPRGKVFFALGMIDCA